MIIVERKQDKQEKLIKYLRWQWQWISISKPWQKRSHLVDILLEGDRFIMSGLVAWYYRPFYTRLIRYLSRLDKCKHLRRHSFLVVRLCFREYLMTTSPAAAVKYDDELSGRAGWSTHSRSQAFLSWVFVTGIQRLIFCWIHSFLYALFLAPVWVFMQNLLVSPWLFIYLEWIMRKIFLMLHNFVCEFQSINVKLTEHSAPSAGLGSHQIALIWSDFRTPVVLLFTWV